MGLLNKKTEPKWGFHGEVLFQEMALPKGTKILKNNVLQGSSQRGHEHIVKKGTFELHETKDKKLFMVVKKGVIIGMKQATERHSDVNIPDNTTWYVSRALETDHFSKVIRSICD